MNGIDYFPSIILVFTEYFIALHILGLLLPEE